jgi:hypothetical protein
MKFKLSRIVFDEKLFKTVSSEVRKQNLSLLRATKTHLKEIAAICQAITTHGLSQNLVYKKLPGTLGHGIFLHPQAQPILKGTIIAPYAGEVFLIPQKYTEDTLYGFEVLSNILLSKEEQTRFDNARRYHPKRIYSLYIDALNKGNFARFINHSAKPNVIAQLFTIPSNSYGVTPSPIEIIYTAKKTIKPGEQLLVNYEGDGNSYWCDEEFKPIPLNPQTLRLDASLKVIGSLPTE